MDANEIHGKIMTMDFNNQREVAKALEYIAGKLCQFEYEIEMLKCDRAAQPYTPCLNNDFNHPL